MSTLYRAIAVLDLSRHFPTLITQGRAILQGMTGNAYFPNPNPPLAQIASHLKTLESSEATAGDGGRAAIAARNAARIGVVGDLPTLQASTTVAGLTPATLYYFRYRAVTKTGLGDWSQILSLLVA